MTGMHTVADIFCVGCGSIVGWTYVRYHKAEKLRSLYAVMFFFFMIFDRSLQETAFEKNQKYKEGKSVLER